MADQDAQIDGPYEAVAGVVALTVEGVVGDVADQEQGREDERRDHRLAMGGDAPRPDERETDEQGAGAQAIQQGVEGGQKGELLAGGVRRGVNVDQPEKKQGSDGTDGKNGGDGGTGA